MFNRQILSIKRPWKCSSVVFGARQPETLKTKTKQKAKLAENLAGLKQGAGTVSETVFLCCWKLGDGAGERVLSRGGPWQASSGQAGVPCICN